MKNFLILLILLILLGFFQPQKTVTFVTVTPASDRGKDAEAAGQDDEDEFAVPGLDTDDPLILQV